MDRFNRINIYKNPYLSLTFFCKGVYFQQKKPSLPPVFGNKRIPVKGHIWRYPSVWFRWLLRFWGCIKRGSRNTPMPRIGNRSAPGVNVQNASLPAPDNGITALEKYKLELSDFIFLLTVGRHSRINIYKKSYLSLTFFCKGVYFQQKKPSLPPVFGYRRSQVMGHIGRSPFVWLRWLLRFWGVREDIPIADDCPWLV